MRENRKGLQNGLIDGYATSPPFTTQAVLSGEAVMLASGLTDAPDLVPFGYALLYGKPETCAQQPNVCSKLARAFATAARLVHEEPDRVFEEVLRKRFATMDADLLKAAWERVRDAHARDVRVTARHFENAQKVSMKAGLLEPAATFEGYDGLFTNEFIQ